MGRELWSVTSQTNMAASSERRTMFQCEDCHMFFLSMEVFYNHPCVASAASGVTGVNLSQDRTEEEIDRDIKKQEEEEESCKWSQAPTLLLIASYKERQDRIDTGRLKKKKAFEEIAQVLKEHQYPFTDAQCTSRMKTLIRQYKTVKDNNNTSGSKRKSFIYENELDSLFKGSPSIRPEFVMSSATATHMSQSDEDGDELDDEGEVTRADNCKRKTEHIADEKVSVPK
ncbi:uncharacterized protein LOC132715272 [Ruditapes philippinarum]|uniref:uncharacterized protein LOC132715272 n=1 Tax=Ruditapes philippinarum TaxID=129788 RepID=UPI00295AE47A|nr:uncharacterized protein LOC132715272 [Ruditapes philippinarum]